MSLGLFLDVDRTLTVDLIQRQYAQHLGVGSSYEEIESLFRDEKITSAEFGRRLISIFSSAGFSKEKALAFFDKVELQAWTDHLLELHDGRLVSVYLVSAGPDYYVNTLANQFGIPVQNVFCSKYEFNAEGRLVKCRSVDKQSKEQFVEEAARQHGCTIGVGDDSRHDGPFLSRCDIQILTSKEDGSLYTPTLQVVRNLARNLARRLFSGTHVPESRAGTLDRGQVPSVDFQQEERAGLTGVARPAGFPSVFIGCSREQLGSAEVFQRQIEKFCDASIWRDGVFQPSEVNVESLEQAVARFDFGVFFMVAEDTVLTRHDATWKVRDNVLFELGLFVGGLGRSRCLLLVPESSVPLLPSDLSGIVVVPYDDQRIQANGPAAFRGATQGLEERIKECGRRSQL